MNGSRKFGIAKSSFRRSSNNLGSFLRVLDILEQILRSKFHQSIEIALRRSQPRLQLPPPSIQFAYLLLFPSQIFLRHDVGSSRALSASLFFLLFSIMVQVQPVQSLSLLCHPGLIVRQRVHQLFILSPLGRYPLQRARQGVYRTELLGTAQ